MTIKIKFLLIACVLYSCTILAQSTSPTIYWREYPVKESQKSASFIYAADVNNDGFEELLLSTLIEAGGGPEPYSGALRLFYNKKQSVNRKWTEKILIDTAEGLGFINNPVFTDVDQDGILDILVHQGFLRTETGSFFWLKGPHFSERHYITEETVSSTFFWHESVQIDLDKDGLMDLVSTSLNTKIMPPVKRIEWYQNQGSGTFRQHIISEGYGGVFITNYDIDGDQDQDLVVSQFFGPPLEPSLVWLELTEQPSEANAWTGKWTTHTIDATTGLGFHIEFYDVDADGRDELVYDNHNNLNNPWLVGADGNTIESGIYWFEIPEDPASATFWEKQVIDEGFPITSYDYGNPTSQGSPGIFSIGDLDNDGLPDVVLPGDGAKDLYFLQQQADHTFKRSTIATGNMYGMAKITDIDGDGKPEVLAAMHNSPGDVSEVGLDLRGHLKIYKPKKRRKPSFARGADNRLIVFPSPATHQITISLESGLISNKYHRISIVDINNQKTFYCQGVKDSQTVDISSWESGMYFIKLHSEDGTILSRFLKK